VRRLLTLALAVAALAVPTAALGNPHHAASGHRMDAYHAAIWQRHDLRRLVRQELRQAARTHRSVARPRHVSWSLPRLRRARAWRWRVLVHLRHLPTWRPPRPTSVVGAVCYFWHPCGPALRVFTCESGLSTTAANGQYLGLAQMGEYARGRYGHGRDAWTQARAAHAYYVAAGWGPWECAHLTGVG
jgi:hypothetical protein